MLLEKFTRGYDNTVNKKLKTVQPFSIDLLLSSDGDITIDYNNIDLFTVHNKIIIFDAYKGYLYKYDPLTDIQEIINRNSDIRSYTGFAVKDNKYYFIYRKRLLEFDSNLNMINEWLLDIAPDSFTIDGNIFYFYVRDEFKIYKGKTCDKSNSVLIIDNFEIEGIGYKGLFVEDNNLWHCDSINNLVYCCDKNTGITKLTIPTPFLRPIGITVFNNEIYICFEGNTFIHFKKCAKVNTVAGERYRKPFVHKLNYKKHENKNRKYITSNSFLVEFIYTLEADVRYKEDKFEDFYTRVALPYNTDRQELISVKHVGLPFKIVDDNGIKMAEFKVGKLAKDTNLLFGYKALVKLSGIKYEFDHSKYKKSMIDYKDNEIRKYLRADDDLDMDDINVQKFAEVAESDSIIDIVNEIRHKVYSTVKYDYELIRSSYPKDIIYDRKTGCGGYSRLILACLRLNGIPARDSGKYSCQSETFAQYENETVIFNHSWLEFYLPEIGWIPMEGSRDAYILNGRNRENGWLGIDWTHIECLSNSNRNFEYAFEKDASNRFGLGGLITNNPSFRILGEFS